ncbi:MAG: putative Ig domain-containing protein [Acidobacteriota bacterium]
MKNWLKTFLLVCIALLAVMVTPAIGMAATYYISPGGNDVSGTGTSLSPWASFTKAYSEMIAGDTLIVKNGTYTNQSVLTREYTPPFGTAAKYTTIKAETSGKAIIDGQHTSSPINMPGPGYYGDPKYIEFSGLVFKNQAEGAFCLQVNHLKFIQCGFEDAADGNSCTVDFGRSSYILLEDCFAWGSGRYKFAFYHTDNSVMRRCVARFDRANPTHDGGSEPIGAYSIYACSNVEVQDCISLDGDKPDFWIAPGEYSGSFYVPSTDGPSTNVYFRGCMALNNAMQFGQLTKNLTNINYIDCFGWHLQEGIWARDGANYNHCTFGDFYGPSLAVPDVGLYFYPGDDPVNSINIINSILTGIKGTAITSFASEDYNVLFGNNANYADITPGSHSVTNANPNLKYLPRIEGGNAVLHGTANDGEDRGANIIKKIGVSGTLWGDAGYNTVTADNLWPFPNEDTIQQYMSTYTYTGLKSDGTTGTISGQRGFCAPGQTLTKYIWEYLGNPIPPEIYGTGGNTAPSFSPIPDQNVNENGTVTFDASAVDAEGDPISYTASNLPTGAAFVGHTFTWTPASGQAGVYNVTITASDGSLSNSIIVKITVKGVDVTAPAAISNLSAGNASKNNVVLNWTAPGNDGSVGTASNYDIRYSNSPITETNWAQATQGTGEPVPQVAGTSQSMTIAGLTAGQTYYFAIKTADEVPNVSTLSNCASTTTLPANRTPVFNATPDKSVTEGATLTFAVTATDPDSDPLTYSAANLPSGATFTGSTFSWKPLVGQAGTYTVTFIVSDGVLSSSMNVVITVVPGGSSNANLRRLSISPGKLMPSFKSGITNYRVDLRNSISQIIVNPTAADTKYRAIYVNGRQVRSGQSTTIALLVGVNNITIEVVAQNGTKKTYTIVVNRAAAKMTLKHRGF